MYVCIYQYLIIPNGGILFPALREASQGQRHERTRHVCSRRMTVVGEITDTDADADADADTDQIQTTD